jgi:glycolate oxidase FAD binding subunit
MTEAALRAALEGALPPEALAAYDEVERWRIGGAEALGAVLPGSVEEVQTVLRIATSESVGVVPVGSMVDPGCEAPLGPFLAMGMTRLTGIEDYEPADLTVTARCGTELAHLASALAEHGQWLPLDPPGAPRRTLGGLVASGAAGPLSMAYGPTRDHVLGVTVVTGDARVLKLGGRVMKNVAGFDLVRLMVGSRGTLGVVISATLRLFPKPEEDRVLVLGIDAPERLPELAGALRTAPVVPASALLLDPYPGGPDRGAGLLVRLQGAGVAVDVEEQVVLGAATDEARSFSGAEAEPILERARDAATEGDVVLRAQALPSALGDLIELLNDALPQPGLAADVLIGRVRASVAVDHVNPGSVKDLRAHVRRIGGDLVLERAPRELVESVGAYGDGGPAGAIRGKLRERFDPHGVLSVGRFT